MKIPIRIKAVFTARMDQDEPQHFNQKVMKLFKYTVEVSLLFFIKFVESIQFFLLFNRCRIGESKSHND